MNRRRFKTDSETNRPAERFDRGLQASVILHVVLAVLLITSPSLFPAFGDIPWGSEAGGGGGISVNLVDASGIPLPAPLLTRPDAVGNDSTGLYAPLEETESVPPPDAPPADAELIPETFPEVVEAEAASEPEPVAPVPEPEPVRTPPTPSSSAPPEEAAPVPDNVVPFGEGGQPDVGAGFSSSQGTYGLGIGDGAFGEQYGRYVDAMRRRLSDSWYQSMVNSRTRPGLRVTLGFEILRNGSIRNVHIVDPSGERTLDESAERAILRVRQLEPLPPTYRGASIDVEFWFEFAR